jgi:hypothetical protein
VTGGTSRGRKEEEGRMSAGPDLHGFTLHGYEVTGEGVIVHATRVDQTGVFVTLTFAQVDKIATAARREDRARKKLRNESQGSGKRKEG